MNTTSTVICFIHHTFQILNDGVKLLSCTTPWSIWNKHIYTHQYLRLSLKKLWPLFMDRIQLPQGYRALREGSLLFTTEFSEIPGTHLINLRNMKSWVNLPSDFEPLILKKSKKSKKCMLVVKIDDLYLKFVILLMNRTLETRCSHCISWCCLYYEEEISVLQSSQDTKFCFLRKKEHVHYLLV